MISVAENKGVPLRSVRVDATGHVERRRHLYELILLELEVDVETERGHGPDVERLAVMAREGCLVGNALDVPVRPNLVVDEAALTETVS